MNIFQFVPKSRMHTILDIIQDYIFPPTCILCSSPGFNNLDLCESCYRHLERNTQCCYQCAASLEVAANPNSVCGQCLSSPPAFDRTCAPFLYQGSLRYLILGLKTKADYENARLLGLLLAEYVLKNTELPNCILPVPLHTVRYRERGFNQVIEIARVVASELQIPLNLASCIRHRNTPHQTSLPAKQRRKNIKNSFSLVKPVNAQHVVIIDDVMTTGATVNELAALLKKSGVKRVDVWVCARA